MVIEVKNDHQIRVYSNDQQMANVYFQNVFLNNFLNVTMNDMHMVVNDWVVNPHDVMYFCGTVHAAFGLWGNLLVERQLSL